MASKKGPTLRSHKAEQEVKSASRHAPRHQGTLQLSHPDSWEVGRSGEGRYTTELP